MFPCNVGCVKNSKRRYGSTCLPAFPRSRKDGRQLPPPSHHFSLSPPPPPLLPLPLRLPFSPLLHPAQVVGDLSEYGRVISFDRPGFGKTERVMPPAGLPSWRLCAKTMGENPYSADFAAKALFGVLDRSVAHYIHHINKKIIKSTMCRTEDIIVVCYATLWCMIAVLPLVYIPREESEVNSRKGKGLRRH